MSDLTFKAGAAKAIITPTEPMWLAGWAVRKEPSRGTISELFCRALTIEDANGTKLVIVSVDLIALPKWLVDPVAENIERQFRIKREQLIFCASHTHCGPEIRPDKEYFFQIPHEWMQKVPAYNEQLQETMKRVIAESIEKRAPAELYFSQTKATFGQNRRKGNTVHDEDVPLLDVRSPDGAHIAIVFGYACHNLTLDPQDRRFCADWSGFGAEQLERDNPGSVALFLTGAGADQDPVPRGTLELAHQHGEQIAGAISRSLGGGKRIDGTIGTTWTEVPLIFQNVTRAQLDADIASEDLPRKRKAQWLLDKLNK
ncbi:MAG TPA: neutral/alkaline non-lysosomal ceramidase N-terminal domain-containing protein, partial [Tepidisphaeraceae bacterium]|nr:neutral/alkaline non-lysosomal ceramidase N-terminal domain-containing protein [Tepidisphaeraceae bacterium]